MKEYILISYSLSHVCVLLCIFLFTKLQYSFRQSVAILTAAGLFLVGMEGIQYLHGDDIKIQISVLVMQIMGVQATAVTLSGYRGYRALFTGMSASNYVLLGNCIGIMFYASTQEIILSIVIGCFINLAVLAVITRFARDNYLEIQAINRKEWRVFCLVPALFYMSVYLVVLCWKQMPGRVHPVLAVISILLTMYVAYGLVFQMIKRTNGEEQAKKGRDVLYASIKSLKWEMEEVRIANEQITLFRHDKRHFLRSLQTMIQKGDYQAVERILEEAAGMVELPQSVCFCQNIPVNGVVSHYVAKARESQIQIDTKLDIEEKLSVNEWELAVVIGNLLENAVNACCEIRREEDRTIWFSARQIRGQLLFEITNTYAGNILFDSDSGLPISNRGVGHGVGMRSILYFARQNDATFDCGIENGRFFARMLV